MPYLTCHNQDAIANEESPRRGGSFWGARARAREMDGPSAMPMWSQIQSRASPPAWPTPTPTSPPACACRHGERNNNKLVIIT